jgi:hypothetical protein
MPANKQLNDVSAVGINIAAWKVEQATDVLMIFPGCVFGQVLARTIPVPGQTLSRIIAIPCPTPMHMVHKA